MDSYLLHSLGKALYTLERQGGSLDDLMIPKQSCSGENSGRPPSRRGSKPPLNLTMLELKNQTEKLLCFWSSQLCGVLPDGAHVPIDRGIDVRSRWLLGHLAYFDDLPSGELAATEIIAHADLILEVVGGSDGQMDSPPEYGTCRVIASWLVNQGYSVNHMRVYRWAKAGSVRTRIGDNGEVLVCYDDVERLCLEVLHRLV